MSFSIEASEQHFTQKVPLDILIVMGSKVGEGGFRSVFTYRQDPTKVIKVARDVMGIRHNMQEFDNYENLPSELRKYFAEIYYISDGGHCIIQERVDPCPTMRRLEVNLPDVHDIKRENIGITSKGKYVISDIGFRMKSFEPDMPIKKLIFEEGNNWPSVLVSEQAQDPNNIPSGEEK